MKSIFVIIMLLFEGERKRMDSMREWGEDPGDEECFLDYFLVDTC